MIAVYAADDVPAYWVVSLCSGRIEAQAEPVGVVEPGYRRIRCSTAA